MHIPMIIEDYAKKDIEKFGHFCQFLDFHVLSTLPDGLYFVNISRKGKFGPLSHTLIILGTSFSFVKNLVKACTEITSSDTFS